MFSTTGFGLKLSIMVCAIISIISSALQVDLGVPKTVRGIITQGARGLEGSTSAENRAFVRKYKLAHSLTGKDWTYMTDSKTGFAKV